MYPYSRIVLFVKDEKIPFFILKNQYFYFNCYGCIKKDPGYIQVCLVATRFLLVPSSSSFWKALEKAVNRLSWSPAYNLMHFLKFSSWIRTRCIGIIIWCLIPYMNWKGLFHFLLVHFAWFGNWKYRLSNVAIERDHGPSNPFKILQQCPRLWSLIKYIIFWLLDPVVDTFLRHVKE